jgi:hypothetical protein
MSIVRRTSGSVAVSHDNSTSICVDDNVILRKMLLDKDCGNDCKATSKLDIAPVFVRSKWSHELLDSYALYNQRQTWSSIAHNCAAMRWHESKLDRTVGYFLSSVLTSSVKTKAKKRSGFQRATLVGHKNNAMKEQIPVQRITRAWFHMQYVSVRRVFLQANFTWVKRNKI